MIKKLSKWFLMVGLVATLAACGGEGNASSSSSDGENEDWPEEIALVQMPNENNPNAASMHSQLRDHLSEELGIEVVEHQGGSYAVGIEAMASGNIDIMVATPMSYYQAQQKAGAELLVTPQAEDAPDYYTSFITQADNEDINSIEDLEGTNFAFVNAASSSGYLYPKATLVQELDLDPDRVEESGYFFENVTFSESHPNSIMGVAMGDYEAAAVGQLDMMIEAGNVEEDEIKVIGRTQDIPDASYIVRGDLPDDLKDALRDAFVSFEDEEYFEAVHNTPNTRFVATEPDYYDPAIEMLEAINALEEE